MTPIDRRKFIAGAAAGAAGLATATRAQNDRRPNIVIIYSDDIGYGDLTCYGARMVNTRNLDRLAREGLSFSDAHSNSAVCSPSRYSLLTGEYAHRNPVASNIMHGLSPLAIGPDQWTLPKLFQQKGYATGLVGKWHLGLGTEENPVDYNREITPGPLEVGFDSAFFIPATADRVPCVLVENHRVAGLDPNDPIEISYKHQVGDDPTGLERPDLLKMKADPSHSGTIVNGISRIGWMSGGNSARWVDEDMGDVLTQKALDFIEQNRDRPFLLYFPTSDIHEPMAPHPRFKGTSGAGTRGDDIHQLDWCVGQILDALDQQGLTENTIVIFTSDNGGAIKDTYDDGTNPLHSRQPPNGELRGAKFSLYEGGHRVPFIIRWPGHIAPDTKSDQLIGQIDLLPSLAHLAGIDVPAGAAPDAQDLGPALRGDGPGRDQLLHHLSGPVLLAVRQGPWKLIPLGAGVTTDKLYNLEEDLGEQHNLVLQHPAKALQLRRLLLSLARDR